MLHLVHICFLFFTWILKVLISKSHIKIKENALTFHNIISFFQHEKKHEHTMLYFPYLLDELKKYLSTNHISKQKKPPGRSCHTFKRVL